MVSLSHGWHSIINKIAKIFYFLLNAVCMIVFADQIYLWLKSGAWVKIPTNIILPGQSTSWQVFSEWQMLGSIWNWILDVELMYTLSVFAMIFYVVRFLPNKQGQKKETPSVPL
jgi:hypothetical protein